ncbi:hypothetical protein CHLNCDRAFT_142143 [Chlorella variabilis]|uniref:Uncharacterized protein n=1 Tax=Chlorella variabilis TaxID=554065 RepID=E1Z7V7_CHLVA|nr:hypothetical protein CHLNCDRAFT_142143 [Chlorella variabilis]EFN58239.1 hypothetical protein CHLNCDRAFT_142143 [Chlorella variabilis]|eukprot:XP_005850341.1 hypothetical protein CHLNCDRAFT_142143 [Chlorella variabilis]
MAAACLAIACLLATPCTAAGGPKRLLLQALVPAVAPLPPPASEAAAPATGSCCQQLAAIGFSSNLPIVVLDTAGKKLEQKNVDVPLQLCTCSPASASATKKSFDVKLLKEGGKKNATGTQKNEFPFLGMPADSDWVLYGGDEVDLTQGMRNWLAYNLGRASGQYAPRTVWCEVFLVDDGAPALSPAHYHGIYIGLEKLKVAPQRVAVAPLEPPNLSGGYLFSYDNDNLEEGDVTFGPLQGWQHPFQMKDPKKAGPEALAWLTGYLQAFQDALEAPDWLIRSPSYTTFIDGPSWLDYFLLTELTKNPDGYRGSVYLHKDRDQPLAAGPIWDLNEAFGLCCGYPIEGWDKQGGWRFMICADPERCRVNPTDGLSRWRMWQDPRFSFGARARWAALRSGPWSDAVITQMVADVSALIRPAVLRNFDRYAAVLLKPWYSSAEQEWTTEVANLQDWLSKHLAWMDAAFAQSGAAPTTPAGRR